MLCNHCKQNKPIDAFYEGSKKRPCKDCSKILEAARYAKKKQNPQFMANRRQYAKNEHRRKRLAVIAHYGGKCDCCGEDRYEFLSIDHIHGGGNQHRKQIGNQRLGTWVYTNGMPEGFRILCHNCNQAIGHYGYCPHQVAQTLKVA